MPSLDSLELPNECYRDTAAITLGEAPQSSKVLLPSGVLTQPRNAPGCVVQPTASLIASRCNGRATYAWA
ncbi:hypothetical protein ACKKBG_A01505 [Auxenochlorella protothecoides x Auxenochlorella symbiontica]